jgi:hypothetical protein
MIRTWIPTASQFVIAQSRGDANLGCGTAIVERYGYQAEKGDSALVEAIASGQIVTAEAEG